MSKKSFWRLSLLTLVAVLGIFLQFTPTSQAQSVRVPTRLILHHGKLTPTGETTGINSYFSVYDLSRPFEEVGHSAMQQEKLLEKLAAKDPQAIQQYIRANKLTKLTDLKTDRSGKTVPFTVNEKIQAILIVQVGKSFNTAGQELTAQPLILNFPITDSNGNLKNEVDVYTKSALGSTPGSPKPEKPAKPGQSVPPTTPGKPTRPTPNRPNDVKPTRPTPSQPNNIKPTLPTTGVIKKQAFWLGLALVIISLVTIIILKRRKGEDLDEEK